MFDEIKCHEFLNKAKVLSAPDALRALTIDYGIADDHDMFVALMEMVLQLNDRLGYLEHRDRDILTAFSDMDVNHPGKL